MWLLQFFFFPLNPTVQTRIYMFVPTRCSTLCSSSSMNSSSMNNVFDGGVILQSEEDDTRSVTASSFMVSFFLRVCV